MGDSIGEGGSRICSYCSARNKAGHRYCVRCSAPLDAAGRAALPMVMGPRPGRVKRYVLAAGVVAAIAAGFMVRAVVQATREVPALSEDVHADSTAAVAAPPAPVSGWAPGGSVPVEPEPAYAAAAARVPAWSADSFPVARPNPYDVPGDPSASMVGIAPRAQAAMAGRRSFTDDDLLATRGAAN